MNVPAVLSLPASTKPGKFWQPIRFLSLSRNATLYEKYIFVPVGLLIFAPTDTADSAPTSICLNSASSFSFSPADALTVSFFAPVNFASPVFESAEAPPAATIISNEPRNNTQHLRTIVSPPPGCRVGNGPRRPHPARPHLRAG